MSEPRLRGARVSRLGSRPRLSGRRLATWSGGPIFLRRRLARLCHAIELGDELLLDLFELSKTAADSSRDVG